jgi:hypothetical protein
MMADRKRKLPHPPDPFHRKVASEFTEPQPYTFDFRCVGGRRFSKPQQEKLKEAVMEFIMHWPSKSPPMALQRRRLSKAASACRTFARELRKAEGKDQAIHLLACDVREWLRDNYWHILRFPPLDDRKIAAWLEILAQVLEERVRQMPKEKAGRKPQTVLAELIRAVYRIAPRMKKPYWDESKQAGYGGESLKILAEILEQASQYVSSTFHHQVVFYKTRGALAQAILKITQ